VIPSPLHIASPAPSRRPDSVKRVALIGMGSMTLLWAISALATTLLGESKKGVAQAYAAVDTFSGTVLAFGGKRATGATASPCGVGCTDVTFTGNFPRDIASSKVILNTTAKSGVYAVTNAQVATASPTTIEVLIYDWQSNNLAALHDTIWVTVFVGR
jgi:hypothetical protein